MIGWHHQLSGYMFEQVLRDGDPWCDAVHGVAKSWTRLND